MDAHWYKTEVRELQLLNLKWKSKLTHLTVKITVPLPSSVVFTPLYLAFECFLLCFHKNSDMKNGSKAFSCQAGMGTQLLMVPGIILSTSRRILTTPTQVGDHDPTTWQDQKCHCIAKRYRPLHQTRATPQSPVRAAGDGMPGRRMVRTVIKTCPLYFILHVRVS